MCRHFTLSERTLAEKAATNVCLRCIMLRKKSGLRANKRCVVPAMLVEQWSGVQGLAYVTMCLEARTPADPAAL